MFPIEMGKQDTRIFVSILYIDCINTVSIQCFYTAKIQVLYWNIQSIDTMYPSAC